jgi:hypothetical protein
MSGGRGPPGHGVVTGTGTLGDKSAVRSSFARTTPGVALTAPE